MERPIAPGDVDKEYVRFNYEGFHWYYRKVLNRHGQVDFEFFGPLCVRNKCHGEMANPEKGKHKCINCGYEQQVEYDSSELIRRVHSKLRGEWVSGIKSFVNFDKLPAINEKLEEDNKFYKVSVEHDETGNLRDVHVLIGRKDNGAKKAHIIVSPSGEIRFHKEDEHPSEEIKSITSIIFK